MQHKSLVAKRFQGEAPYWRDIYTANTLEGELYRVRQGRAIEFAESLRMPAGARVLEVACGAGVNAVALAKRGYRVDAVDAVDRMLGLTRQLAEAEGVAGAIATRCCEAQRLPFAGGSFDLAMALGLMEWLEVPVLGLSEMLRVVRPGGHVLVSVDNLWGLHRVLDPRLCPVMEPLKRFLKAVLTRLPAWNRRARCCPRSIREMDRFIAAAGLVKQRSATAGFGPFTLFKRQVLSDAAGLKVHRELQRRAGRGEPLFRSTGHTYLVLARKGGGETSEYDTTEHTRLPAEAGCG